MRIIFLICIILAGASLNAQNYNISFAGQGVVYDVDSVNVRNEPLNLSLTVDGDEVLILSGNISVDELSSTPKLLNIYPNPSSDKALVTFNTTISQNILLSLYDIIGKKVVEKSFNVSHGEHTFHVGGLRSGTYILALHTDENFVIGKILSNNPTSGLAYIELVSSNDPLQKDIKNAKKGLRKQQVMPYNEGDQLFFTFYSDNYSTVVPHVALKDTVLTAVFVDCQDEEGNNYSTLTVRGINEGREDATYSQIWMAENLNIGEMVDLNAMQSDNSVIEKYCWQNNEDYCQLYGGLYQWDELLQYTTNMNTIGICPIGWHIPSDTEWCNLVMLLDETANCLDNPIGTDAGYKMKSTTGWNVGNGSNSSGFNALPSGVRDIEAYVHNVGLGAYFATSTQETPTSLFVSYLNCDHDAFAFVTGHKDGGYSLRCVQDGPQPTVSTNDITDISLNSALCNANAIFEGGNQITSRGVCWSTLPDPTLENYFITEGTGTGLFQVTLNNLNEYNKYFVRAFATNSFGIAYGDNICFETYSSSPVIPSVTTLPVYDTLTTSAMSGGNITTHGGEPVTDRGLCWSTQPMPDIYDEMISAGTGSGEFECFMTNLLPNTLYYIRAYATNSVGIAYGTQLQFTTLQPIFPPVVTSAPVTDILLTYVTSGGDVTYWGGAPVTQRGVCWSTSPVPTIDNNLTIDGSGIGSFVSYVRSLIPYTTYYIRAYAINSSGVGYGNEFSFTTNHDELSCPGTPLVTHNGYNYNTVQIGTQCWLRDNFNGGVFTTEPATDDNILQKYCYDDNPANCDRWGAMYTLGEAMDYNFVPGSQGICPQGWHIPTDEEWCTLSLFVDSTVNCQTYSSGTDAGIKMKAKDGWYGQGNGTNSSGFSAYTSGGGTMAFYWTSTPCLSDPENLTWNRHFEFQMDGIGRSEDFKDNRICVRCIKDQ